VALTLRAPALEPAMAQPPPILVGGRGEAALHRAARFGDAWLPMWLTPQTFSDRVERLAELAEANGRRRPALALLLGVHLDADRKRARREAEAYLTGQYGLPLQAVERWSALGSIERVAECVQSYRAAGVQEFVLMALAHDPLRQYERLAAVLERL
jgi:alkanesulfonate monooxygenase SsuD/methylene tetrahydromethanopterin reductase-like flavin-dependent oxidoreductase (luciferase family)